MKEEMKKMGNEEKWEKERKKLNNVKGIGKEKENGRKNN